MPAVALVLVGFIVIISALSTWGMLHTSTGWLRALLNGLAHPHHAHGIGGILQRLALAPVTYLARGVLRIEHYVESALSAFAAASSDVLAAWLEGIAHVWHSFVAEVEAIPNEVANALFHFRYVWLPRELHRVINPVKQVAHAAHWLAVHANAYAHAEAHRIWRGIDQLDHRLTARFTKLYHGIDQFVHHTVWPRVRVAERDIAGILERDLPRIRAEEKAFSRRLTKLEKLLGVAALTGALVRILARRFPWLFCRNVTNVGKRVCGLDPSIIGDAFGLLVTAEMLTNLPELVRILQTVERETAEAIKELAEV